MLNGIWFALILIAIISSVGHFFLTGDIGIFSRLVQSLFDSAKLSFDVVLGLVGVLSLWLGFFNIALRAGIVDSIAKGLQPVFSKLMPDVPKGDPAVGAMTMNLAANMLGLDNAATPLGLKAMQELQRLNPSPLIASNAQILFIVLNASSVTLLPVTIFMYRAQQGAVSPTDVFLPILIATSVSTLAGLSAV
ncbi:MAG TPA: nucleoside recognition domain-containing protein, partial [Pseudomonadales bacterium]|nr:nucleoside recognition domain-containing protein [Pseudomonadales bacterium]